MSKLSKLSLESRRVVEGVPAAAQSAVRQHLQKLEREVARHRAASIALVVADAKGEADSHTDWNDVDAARVLAEKALGAKEVKRIRKEVREALGGGEEEEDEE